ncbi:MAG: AAA family ATPase [Caulobacter sp.]|nr:AAA family ATPase [Caulobacter sp.]
MGLQGEDGYLLSRIADRRDGLVVITGCSGGGKSSLLAELARRGHRVFEEPGRQIVREQDWLGGDALPWTQPLTFAELAVSRSVHNLVSAARLEGAAFFDRGVVDQLAGLERLGLAVPAVIANAAERCRYAETVFVAPPWPEIYRTDAERRHGFEGALAEYEVLLATYRRLDYRLVEIPRRDVAARADFVLGRLGL